jgi:hypothetical protein
MQAAQRLQDQHGFHRVGRSFVVEIWFASARPGPRRRYRERLCRGLYRRRHPRHGQSAEERAAGWRRGCRTCAPRRRQRRRRPSSSGATWCRRSAGPARTGATGRGAERSRLRFQNRYRELALESSFPVSSGRILSRAMPPRDPSAPRATHFLRRGAARPSAGPDRRGPARGARNRASAPHRM